MRKPILPRFKSLLSAACAALHTRQVKPALATDPATPDDTPDEEAWLFEAETAYDATRAELSNDMNGLANSAAMGDTYDDACDEILFWMADEGRLGRKANAGFYAYDEKGKRQGLWAELADKYAPAETQPDLIEVQHRLLFAQVLEAVRALEENVLMDIREGDVGAILGWGFAPWSGGPLSWLDMIGSEYAAERCEQLSAAYGERFACPDLLRDMAQKGQSFYGRFGKKAEAA